MKKFLSFLIICFVASSLKSAFAFDHSMVFGGISVGEDMSYGNLGVVTAFNRNLEKNGSLLRVSAGYNNYNYSTTTRSINSNISDSDLMFGHQFVAEDSKIILFGGANYSDSGVSRFDMNNRAAGGKVGAKGQFEMYLVPMRDVFFSNISNYSSAYNSYSTQSYLGYDFKEISVGPEVHFLGNRSFDQQRFGVRVSRIDLDFMKIYVSGGYLKSRGRAGDEGAYTTIGFFSKF